MNLSNISTNDWVSLAVGLIGFITAYISRQSQLPAWARKWQKLIGNDRVTDAIQRAADLANLTPEQRQKEAALLLKQFCRRDLGIDLPTSIANFLVEYAYQSWKRSNK